MRLWKAMEVSKTKIISLEFLFEVFQEQLN